MIDERTLAWDHDEEALGFPEPPAAPAPPVPLGERLGALMVGLGALALVLLLVGGEAVRSAFGLGGYGALLASFGWLSAGAALVWWVRFHRTPAGIRQGGTFFRSAQNRGLIGWVLGIGLTGFYVVLFFYDDLMGYGMPALLESATRLLDPLAGLLAGAPADRWFLYGFLYTMAVLVFGVRMLLKYRHSRHHTLRTLVLMAVQLVLAFLLPQILRAFQQPEFYFSYFWPLKPEYLFPADMGRLAEQGALTQFMLFWTVAISFVAVPVLTYYWGKRWYCSWVCGCAGLAETLGDPWRQLSDKSTGAWKVERWMVHGVLVFITLVTAVLWINSAREGQLLGAWSSPFAKAYGFLIGAIFSGVIGVGFYPLMGSRVWCRFGCPQAAILGIIQRFFSRFRITTNGGQCMSCGNCSTYCEMGIDVKQYAQAGKNIVRASCVGCGVCASVCPRGVLKLENGPTHADRFEGAHRPLEEFKRSLGLSPR